MLDDAVAREAELRRWITELTGATITALYRRPGGGSHEAWNVEADGNRRWFLRADRDAPNATDFYTLRREAEIYRAVHAAGLPTPAIIGIHPTLEAVLLEAAAGDAGYANLDASAQAEIIEDFAPLLARMHAADVRTLGLEALGPITTMAEHVRHELDVWEARLDAAGVPDPFLTACFHWLRANVPNTDGEPVALVQGDTGPGNFLHDGHRVTALLDFELGHLGDPMEDLAWVGTRNAQEPVPDFERFLSAYAAAAVRPIDRDRIRYHALLAELRIAVLGAKRVGNGGDLDADYGNQLIYGALHRRLTVEALAAATGTALPAVALPPATDTARTRYYDAALHQMQHTVGPHVADAFASRRLKGMARVFKYLREADRVGSGHDEAELDDLTALLGHRPANVDQGTVDLHALVLAGHVDAVALIPYAYGQAMRRTHVVGPAMGALATRHLPTL
jgi:aminoglycoside phosphotransferase (APT) family kinase protein